MSVAAAITPLVKAAQPTCRTRWAANVAAYTAAGAVSSAFVGMVLGAIGATLPGSMSGTAGLVLAVGVASLAIARESGVEAIPLPQCKRATPGAWARNLEGPVVPALWGFDLGLCFTTYFTFAGPWLLVALAVLSGAPWFGAALFLAYWFGRSLSVWLAPLLLPDASSTPQLIGTFVVGRRQFQLLHVAGLILMAIVLVGMSVTSTPLG